jgi:ketosteroid isomerase-like protein
MRKRMYLLMVPAALLTGYAAGLNAARDDRSDLMQLDREFDEAVARGGSVAWASYFAEDGVLLPMGSNIVMGRKAIQEHMSQSFSDPKFKLRWEPLAADVSKDIGYTYGLYRAERPGDDGKVATSHGKYVTIWKKQRGEWKIVLDAGNPSPAPAK